MSKLANKRKQEIPKNIQTKFQRPQYQVGDFVCITWLGELKFGQVVETNKKNDHVRYKVKSHGRYYTCGIQIGNFTSENVGYGILLADDTNRRGATEIRSRAIGRPVYEVDRRPIINASNETASTRQAVDDNNNTITTSRKRTAGITKNSAKHGVTHDSKTKSKSARKPTTKLDEAIQRQKDFLNGFVKK